ncbi:hypothetical protein C8R32_10872 [Nitrosospira sp. Nsp5]|nr:hypothetical protein C8R32_10872 [Nitrosospira sp. Nsp5]
MEFTSHAVIRADSLTGAGNSLVFTLRQSVAEENGTMAGINCDWRMYPEAGSLPKFELLFIPYFPYEVTWYGVKLAWKNGKEIGAEHRG